MSYCMQCGELIVRESPPKGEAFVYCTTCEQRIALTVGCMSRAELWAARAALERYLRIVYHRANQVGGFVPIGLPEPEDDKC